MKIHPLAQIIPPLTPDEIERMQTPLWEQAKAAIDAASRSRTSSSVIRRARCASTSSRGSRIRIDPPCGPGAGPGPGVTTTRPAKLP